MLTNLLVAFLCLIWGGTWVVIKVGLEDSPPFLSATLRFVIAVAVLGAIVFIGKRPHPRGGLMWWRMVLPGVFMYAIPYAAVYWAAQYIPAALNSILFATFPFFVAILAHFYLPNERLNPIKWLGLFGGLLGLLIIFNDSLSIPGARVIPAMSISGHIDVSLGMARKPVPIAVSASAGSNTFFLEPIMSDRKAIGIVNMVLIT